MIGMGMALPNPKYDEQQRARSLQAEKALPREYIQTLEKFRCPAMPRLHLWGLMVRWTSLPITLRHILAAVMLLCFLGAFTATAHIKANAAVAQLQRVGYSNARFEDNLAEFNSFNQTAFYSGSEGIGKVTD